jgi:tRNA pseudouridine55 synthase
MGRRSSARPPSPHHGILLVDKDQGWTSHDVVAKSRGITGQRKIGHTGTLDPMATGLLVLCLGDATRLVEYMAAHDKRYSGEVTLGATTDTDDAEGTIIATATVPAVADDDLRALEARFRGEQLQRPPAFSAVKVDGQRAYAAARRGNALDLASRPVVVYDIALRRTGATTLAIDVHCGPGTYIRSLARDIGTALGCGGHLSALRRLSVGRFDVDDAVSLAQLQAAGEGGVEALLWAPDQGIAGTPAAILESGNAARFAHGSTLETTPGIGPEGAPLRIHDTSGAFRGVAAIDASGGLHALKVLANSE